MLCIEQNGEWMVGRRYVSAIPHPTKDVSAELVPA
jgi:hypothetical protein